MKWFTNPEEQLVEVAIGQVKGFFSPSDAERAAAYELLVELTTRPSSTSFGVADVSIGEELRSIDEMFELTRSILRKHGTESTKGSAGNLSLAVVALRVLNEVFRPVVHRWRPLLDDHLAQRPDGDECRTDLDWELRWERAQQCRSELNVMRASTRAYIETLSRIAGTPSVAEAILSSPSSEMMPTTRIETSRLPDELAENIKLRHRMVRWLDVRELWESALSMRPAKKSIKKAAKRSPVVTLDGKRRPQPTATFTVDKGEEFWFDYVADMGDGFDGTAPVAWLMGRETLHLPDRGASELPTPPARMPRGELVVFGGDEVYPVAKPGRYEGHTELPFRMGLDGEPSGGGDGAPTLVTIPGNHDWMGGIDEFERIFVSERPFAEHWKTVQRNNWWHVKLPQGWWLWGIDTGLDNHLVGPQEEYFRAAAELLDPGDRVVLCTPVPLWQLRRKHPESYAKLRAVFDPLIASRDATMPLCLSGDTHAFAHLERVDTDRTEDHVMAGGGGAFLQPTHNLPERIPQERGNAEFKLLHRWPSPADSRSLAPGGAQVFRTEYWLFNIIFALVFIGVAALTDLSARLWPIKVSNPADPDGPKIDATSFDQLNWFEALSWSLSSPWVLLVLLALGLVGSVAFVANSREPKLGKAARVYGFVAGLGVGATLVAINATRLVLGIDVDVDESAALGIDRNIDLGIDTGGDWQVLVVAALVAGIAATAAFFSLVKWSNRKIQANDTLALMPANSTRYKHFLRFRIDEQGDLTCYAVGIDPVGTGWYEALTLRDKNDKKDVKVSSVPPYDRAGAPRLHYVWGKTYAKFVPEPLAIAISVSDPAGKFHWSTEAEPGPIKQAVEGLCDVLIKGGHVLMYGGRPQGAMTERLRDLDLIARKKHENNPNAERHIVNYVGDHLWDDKVIKASGINQLHVPPGEYSGSHPAGDRLMLEAVNYSAMRQRMTEDADLRLVIGGNLEVNEQSERLATTPGTRPVPGVLEEAYLAVEAGLPVLIVGGFGGAGGLIADALTGKFDWVLIDELSARFVEPVSGPTFREMLERFTSLSMLRNGLTDGENRELLRTRDPDTVIDLVRRSVYRLGSTR